MDASLFRSINRFADRTPWLHAVATTYATWGIGLFAVLLLVAWWDARSADAPAVAVAAVVWAGMASLLGALAVQLIGAPIDRARPTATLSGTHLLIAGTKDFSFPSDHTTAAAAIAVGLLVAGSQLRHRVVGASGTGAVHPDGDRPDLRWCALSDRRHRRSGPRGEHWAVAGQAGHRRAERALHSVRQWAAAGSRVRR